MQRVEKEIAELVPQSRGRKVTGSSELNFYTFKDNFILMCVEKTCGD